MCHERFEFPENYLEWEMINNFGETHLNTRAVIALIFFAK
jgi:hypothetical protein